MASTSALIATIILHIFFQDTLQSTPEDDSYVAAVVEYHGFHGNYSGEEILHFNVEKHIQLIAEAAKQNADIIVFPELGLLSYDETQFIEVPDPAKKIVPATDKNCHEALRNLSDAAIKYNIYVVTNLHELFKNNSKEYKYNTNIVFDRKGTLIARYRKYNLFGEKFLNRTETPDFVTFDTDFGVTFGTFICFDIIFENPAVGLVRDKNITDIVYSTAWFSELPFHAAIQEQNAWAYSNNVNLLASGFNCVNKGNTGSGIYSGRKGPIDYIQSELDQSHLIIGKVPKKPGTAAGSKVTANVLPLVDEEGTTGQHSTILHEQLDDFATYLLKPETMTHIDEKNITIISTDAQGLERTYEITHKLCHETSNFCCNFNLKFTVKYYPNEYDFNKDDTFTKTDAYYHFRYRLIAFDGIRKYIVDDTTGQQLCALMPCLNDTIESCARANINAKPISLQLDNRNLTLFSTEFSLINITADFQKDNVLYLPSILLSSTDKDVFGKLPTSDQYNLNIGEANGDKKTVSLQLPLKVDETIKLASGGILTRIFDRDNKPNDPNSANIITAKTLFWCSIPIIFYLFRNR
ncbi:hypothetical protein O3M35_010915 [Rhynocoris fuscipes]|uniref:CN hydrolase domain-containing protein n=1 Tax=Rhynocoris fuscipes TaxID=488301 RepID=A0AAW1D7U3_9HEMI